MTAARPKCARPSCTTRVGRVSNLGFCKPCTRIGGQPCMYCKGPTAAYNKSGVCTRCHLEGKKLR